MTDDNVEDIVRSVLRYRLSLRVKSREVYAAFGAPPTREKKIQLVLDEDEVISEIYLDD